jgi:hypothetical protein
VDASRILLELPHGLAGTSSDELVDDTPVAYQGLQVSRGPWAVPGVDV